MLKNKTLKIAALSATLLMSGTVLAQNGMGPGPMMYGQPPMPAMQNGQYPAPPPMNPEMMQRRMEAQQQKMQEMRAQRQAEMHSQKQAMMAEGSLDKPKSCHHGKDGKHKQHKQEMMKNKQAHMERMEKSLANIEKLMEEMLTLMKSKY